MSEFKVGDKVVSTKNNEFVYTVITIDGGLGRLKNIVFDHVYPLHDFRHATPKEIAAGHRIDEVVPVYEDVKFPYNVLTGEQVGAVMNATHFSYDLGDDFPIENHISPNCKAKDV